MQIHVKDYKLNIKVYMQKGHLRSSTIVSAVVLLVVAGLAIFGIEITQSETSAIVDNIDKIISAVLTVFATTKIIIERKRQGDLKGMF